MSVWDTLAIAEYLAERNPEAGMLPKDKAARAHCRSIAGEIHSGFYNLRSALPMNLKARHTHFKVFAGAQPDIDRVQTIWQECLTRWGGPFLYGATPTIADAMYAPVATRFITYNVPLTPAAKAYCATDHRTGRPCKTGSPPPRPNPKNSPNWRSSLALPASCGAVTQGAADKADSFSMCCKVATPCEMGAPRARGQGGAADSARVA